MVQEFPCSAGRIWSWRLGKQAQIVHCSPFFHGCDWAGIAIEEFMGMLDACLRWYRDARTKGDLDCRSPMQYRRDLGLLAA